jgi:3-methylcrotonyl-CoA carboxylase alpha subunit
MLSEGIRIDSGIKIGDSISTYYDPMLAKLIVHGQDRQEALSLLHHALNQFHVIGLKHNIEFLKNIIASPAYQQGKFSTQFLSQQTQLIHPTIKEVKTPFLAAALVLHLEQLNEEYQQARIQRNDPHSPWFKMSGKQINLEQPMNLCFRQVNTQTSIPIQIFTLDKIAGKYSFQLKLNEVMHSIKCKIINTKILIYFDSHWVELNFFVNSKIYYLFAAEEYIALEIEPPLLRFAEEKQAGELISPMPGTIVSIKVLENQPVKKNEPLLVMEAMKMEHTLYSPFDGIVKTIYPKEGDLVPEGLELICIEPLENT